MKCEKVGKIGENKHFINSCLRGDQKSNMFFLLVLLIFFSNTLVSSEVDPWDWSNFTEETNPKALSSPPSPLQSEDEYEYLWYNQGNVTAVSPTQESSPPPQSEDEYEYPWYDEANVPELTPLRTEVITSTTTTRKIPFESKGSIPRKKNSGEGSLRTFFWIFFSLGIILIVLIFADFAFHGSQCHKKKESGRERQSGHKSDFVSITFGTQEENKDRNIDNHGVKLTDLSSKGDKPISSDPPPSEITRNIGSALNQNEDNTVSPNTPTLYPSIS